MHIGSEEYLEHYGMPRRSGRYPYGSGENPQAEGRSLVGHIKACKAEGLTEVEIATGLGMSTTELRALATVERAEQRRNKVDQARKLKDAGLSNAAIANEMGLAGASSVRGLLQEDALEKVDVIYATKNALKEAVDEKGYVDVGTGVENYLGVSKDRLNVSLQMLKDEGYSVNSVKITQAGTGAETTVKVLSSPGTSQRDVWMNKDSIQPITTFSSDGGKTYTKFHDPIDIDLKRVGVIYGKDGGAESDGVIYVRPGVEDVSLGMSRYAQVRVKVGGTHYLKGMAVYKDDLPDGVDLVFNTNKENTGTKTDAFKPLKESSTYPFGTVVRQIIKDPGTDKERPSSAMNIVNEENSWGSWKNSLASQVLSKQSLTLAADRLSVHEAKLRKEFDEINSLTNPAVKKKLLDKFAEKADSNAVDLKAAGLPRQGWHVILPINSLKPNEVYAPNYNDGESVVLIRYPHGGTFEIPELRVNNKNREANKTIGNKARTAIGIHHSVAEKLSGADFDGDTVLVIPNNTKSIKTTASLKELKNFDAKREYKGYEGMPPLSDKRKQMLMGDVSNLITDMSLKQAPMDKLARAVKHSMVVIDAANHNLNYKQSAIDHGIAALKAEYQGGSKKGAATLISKAGSEVWVNDRRLARVNEGGAIDKKTGEIRYVETGKTKTYKDGSVEAVRIKSKKLAETKDAHDLSSGTPMEKLYADHSNSLKGLANQARLSSMNTPSSKYSSSAKKVYAKEVKELDAALKLAKMNAPRERQAQILTSAKMKTIRAENPDMGKDAMKKVTYQVLAESRQRVGASKQKIEITDKQWEAIQSGAVSNSKLSDILDNADMDRVMKLAKPMTKPTVSASMTRRAERLLNSGATRAEVAQQLGISLAALDDAVYGE